jgi:endo-1,4-beta-xylanase
MANLFAQKNRNEQSELTHRKGEIIIKAKPGAKVSIEQLEHEFWFGCAISDGIFNGRASENERKTKVVELKKAEGKTVVEF